MKEKEVCFLIATYLFGNEPKAGLEPATYSLRMSYSTNGVISAMTYLSKAMQIYGFLSTCKMKMKIFSLKRIIFSFARSYVINNRRGNEYKKKTCRRLW